MIKEELKLIKESDSDLKKFGITMGIVAFLVAVLLFYLDSDAYRILLIVFGFFFIAAFTYPGILKPVNRIWMTLAILLGWFMTRVILSVLFYLIVTPTGLIGRMLGKKFVVLNPDKSENSYWIKRTKTTIEKEDFERQF